MESEKNLIGNETESSMNDAEYRLTKEYKVSYDLFREAYRAYQKKYVYPKSYAYMILFLVLAASFIAASFVEPTNTLGYILIVVCLAFAFREWYNPRRLRNVLVDTVKEIGEPLYKIGIGEGYIDIMTIVFPEGMVEGELAEETPQEIDPIPEKSRIDTKNGYKLIEYEKFFLLMSGKTMFYILPKDGFSEDELGIVRATYKKKKKHHSK